MHRTAPAEFFPSRSNLAPGDGRLVWETDGLDWPNRSNSRFVSSSGIDWHVQSFGHSGPRALLLHGTAASTHSWAELAPILASSFQVMAPDLPGHGFTSARPTNAVPGDTARSLPGMAHLVGELLRTIAFKPDLVIGHSAGAAILVRMCLDRTIDPQLAVSLNGALLPFGSLGRYVAPAMARLLFQNSFVPWVFSRQARDRRNVERLILGTGSKLNQADLDRYVRLFRSKAHVEAALAMMANWNLPALERDLFKLTTPLVLLAASEDLAVPPEKASDVQRIIPSAQIEYVRGLGHLAHEEDARRIARIILRLSEKHGLLTLAARSPNS